MKDIGLILKNTREDLDLTQIDVMRRTGINNKTLSGYENGVAEPDLATLAKLLKFYNLSADEILGLNNNKQITESLNSKEHCLLKSFRKLSKERQTDILIMLDALVSQNSDI